MSGKIIVFRRNDKQGEEAKVNVMTFHRWRRYDPATGRFSGPFVADDVLILEEKPGGLRELIIQPRLGIGETRRADWLVSLLAALAGALLFRLVQILVEGV